MILFSSSLSSRLLVSLLLLLLYIIAEFLIVGFYRFEQNSPMRSCTVIIIISKLRVDGFCLLEPVSRMELCITIICCRCCRYSWIPSSQFVPFWPSFPYNVVRLYQSVSHLFRVQLNVSLFDTRVILLLFNPFCIDIYLVCRIEFNDMIILNAFLMSRNPSMAIHVWGP